MNFFNSTYFYVTNRAEAENCTVGMIWLTLTLPMRAAASGSCEVTRVTDTAAKQITLTSKKRPSLDGLHFLV